MVKSRIIGAVAAVLAACLSIPVAAHAGTTANPHPSNVSGTLSYSYKVKALSSRITFTAKADDDAAHMYSYTATLWRSKNSDMGYAERIGKYDEVALMLKNGELHSKTFLLNCAVSDNPKAITYSYQLVGSVQADYAGDTPHRFYSKIIPLKGKCGVSG